MTNAHRCLLACTASISALVISGTAAAQDSASPTATPVPQNTDQTRSNDTDIQDIIVTGSRAVTNGNQAPNPVTVLSTDELLRNTPSTIADALAQAPQFRASLRPSSFVSPQSAVNAFVNLRGLSDTGTPRTLVLFDGRRVTPAIAGGQVDVNMLPNLLVKRVDIVTGGASAAYGSDAVAGVVNYVLDRDFTGLKADINGGVSQRGDNGSQKVALAAGGKFLDDRLHVMGSIEYFNSEGVANSGDRAWLQRHCQAIQNPSYSATNAAGGPNFLFRCGVTGTDFAPGGVITSGPLQGIQFLPGGATAPYRYGSLATTGATMIGGDGVWLPRGNVSAPLQTISASGHIDFDMTDNIRLFAEGTYAHNETDLPFIYPEFAGGSAFTITRDNPFLPANISAQMASLNLASIRVGRASLDWGQSVGHTKQDYYRGAVGFDAKLGGDWVLSGYFDSGRTTIDQVTTNNVNVANARLAADAVVNPANGQIVCRSTLTNPNNGCVPLNIFGEGSASPAALDYIFGDPYTHRKTQQSAAELAVRGSPFSTWAGDVQFAAGFDWRRISASAVADPISLAGGWLAGSQVGQPYGRYNVKEGFGELNVPLADKLPFAYAANIDAAIRYADYSTAGGVTSWKVAGSYSPIADIRLRASRSRDVRAPNLAELFQSQNFASVNVFDAATNSTVQTQAVSGGNPDLKPELADTLTYGVVLQPRFLPRFSLAVDYFDIKIKGAIASISAQQVVNLCNSGGAQYCGLITRANGAITRISSLRQNLNQLRSSGIDFEANYVVPLGADRLSFRLLASYLQHLTTTDAFGTKTEFAGINGGENTASPHWQGNLSIYYAGHPFSVGLQERYISSGRLSNLGTPFSSSPTGPNSIDFDHVPARFYTDLTLQAEVMKGAQFYFTINNLLDQDPPQAPTRTGAPFLTFATNGTLYDVVGRAFTAGVRLRF
jgi:iron complex outermembrane receptor protein